MTYFSKCEGAQKSDHKSKLSQLSNWLLVKAMYWMYQSAKFTLHNNIRNNYKACRIVMNQATISCCELYFVRPNFFRFLLLSGITCKARAMLRDDTLYWQCDLLRFTHAKVNRTGNNYYLSHNASFGQECTIHIKFIWNTEKGKSWQKGYYDGNPGIIIIPSYRLKMTQNIAFEFQNFGFFHQFLSY